MKKSHGSCPIIWVYIFHPNGDVLSIGDKTTQVNLEFNCQNNYNNCFTGRPMFDRIK